MKSLLFWDSPLSFIRAHNVPTGIGFNDVSLDIRECAICLAPFSCCDIVSRFPSCAHLFHFVCLKRWITYCTSRLSNQIARQMMCAVHAEQRTMGTGSRLAALFEGVPKIGGKSRNRARLRRVALRAGSSLIDTSPFLECVSCPVCWTPCSTFREER
eukprot:GHVO01014408.1.p2 GENE.GHVO01014408.1~~GHVO01014408.1.p2  ORF type:complete len:157 (+),score=15.08 GHVO01014408.1:148-618(+)